MIDTTDNTGPAADKPASKRFYTPFEVAKRWHFHEESVRRILRERRMASIVIGRRRLIEDVEIERVEREGSLPRLSKQLT